MTPQFSGIFPVVATPFAKDYSIDYGELETEVDWIYEQGADGVVVALVSEILRLSTEERIELGNKTIEYSNKHNKPAIISVGAESTKVAVDLARAAEDAGAAALMATPPLLLAMPESEIAEYNHAIIEATTIPFIFQDASGYVGSSVSVKSQADWINQYGPERFLLKPESAPLGPKATQIMGYTGGKAQMFDGSGGQALLDTFPRGMVATMPGPDLVWALRKLWDALEADNADVYLPLGAALTSLISLTPGLDGYVLFEKHNLKNQGVLSSTRARGPISFSFDQETKDLIDRLFAQLKELCE